MPETRVRTILAGVTLSILGFSTRKTLAMKLFGWDAWSLFDTYATVCPEVLEDQMDLSHYFVRRKRFEGYVPEGIGDENMTPTIEWSGKDSGAPQLLVGRVDGEPLSCIERSERIWKSLRVAARSFGLTVVPNPTRSQPGDTSEIFFDLEGSGVFNPQVFIDRYSKAFFAQE